MKKLFFTTLFIMALGLLSYAQETQTQQDKKRYYDLYNVPDNGYSGRTDYISSEDYFDAIRKWKSLEGSDWHLIIDYSNASNGEMVLSGWHKLNVNLYCTKSYNGGLEEARVSFKIYIPPPRKGNKPGHERHGFCRRRPEDPRCYSRLNAVRSA